MLNVLIVDDSDIIRTMISKTLGMADIPVTETFEASNGKEALEVLDNNWIDLVLADINMPVMSGVEMIHHMQAEDNLADIPVIVVTSEGHSERIDDLMTYKACTQIRKPFTPEQIRDAIGGIIPNHIPSQHEELLVGVLGEVLQSFAFMFAELPSGETSLDSPGEFFRSRMDFAGDVDGVLSLSVPRMLAIEMAANALGTEPNDGAAQEKCADIVGETLNITCGHVVESLGNGGLIHLEPPVTTSHDSDEWERVSREPGTIICIIDGAPITLNLRVRG